MDCFCSVEFHPFSLDNKCRTHIRVNSSYVYSFNFFFIFLTVAVWGGVAVVFNELQEETDLNKVYSPCLARLLPCPRLSFFNQTGAGFDVIFSAPLLFRS